MGGRVRLVCSSDNNADPLDYRVRNLSVTVCTEHHQLRLAHLPKGHILVDDMTVGHGYLQCATAPSAPASKPRPYNSSSKDTRKGALPRGPLSRTRFR